MACRPPAPAPAAGGAERRRLAAGRWHFRHGPMDCIVAADGEAAVVEAAMEAAWARFTRFLAELVAELPLLRADLASADGAGAAPRGPVARRMVAACRPLAANGRFITAMAAVAGSVAEELIRGFDDPRITRAAVNNGGDIALRLGPGSTYDIGIVADPTRLHFGPGSAYDIGIVADPTRLHFGPGSAYDIGTDPTRLHLGPGCSYDIGIVADPTRVARPDALGATPAAHDADAAHARPGSAAAGRLCITADSAVRGIATSGWRGRSFSFGIADSVTVLAPTASAADALATVIANAVDIDDPRIVRVAADRLRDDTDLGARRVTCAVPLLSAAAVERALAAGAIEAQAQIDAGGALAVVLCLQGRVRTCLAPMRFATLGAGCGPAPYEALPAVPAPSVPHRADTAAAALCAFAPGPCTCGRPFSVSSSKG